MGNSPSVPIGLKRIEGSFLDVLTLIHESGPLSLQADAARARVVDVAVCASLGLITNIVDDTPTRQWRLTHRGSECLHYGEVMTWA